MHPVIQYVFEIDLKRPIVNFFFSNFSECDSQWFKLYNHLCLLLGFYSFEENTKERFEKCRKRIYWLQYSLATYEYDLSEAMNYLEVVSTFH